MRWILLLSLTLLAGCTRLRGVVLEEPSQRPARTAVFSVGRPTGIAVYATHRVDENGVFDFHIGPGDDNNLYLYDGSASPELTIRRIETYEMSQNMKLRLRRATPGTPSLPPAANFSP